MNLMPFKPSSVMGFSTVQADRARFKAYTSSDDELCIDLSEVTACDSAGLAFLIEAKRAAITMNKPLVLQAMPERIRGFALFCGVDQIL